MKVRNLKATVTAVIRSSCYGHQTKRVSSWALWSSCHGNCHACSQKMWVSQSHNQPWLILACQGWQFDVSSIHFVCCYRARAAFHTLRTWRDLSWTKTHWGGQLELQVNTIGEYHSICQILFTLLEAIVLALVLAAVPPQVMMIQLTTRDATTSVMVSTTFLPGLPMWTPISTSLIRALETARVLIHRYVAYLSR